MSDTPVIPISPAVAKLRKKMTTTAAERELKLIAAIEKLNKTTTDHLTALDSLTQRRSPSQDEERRASTLVNDEEIRRLTAEQCRRIAVSLLAAAALLNNLSKDVQVLFGILTARRP